MRRLIPLIQAVLALVFLPCARAGVTVGEVAHLKDTGGSVITGLGLVTGLNGTGDSGKDPVAARPLMAYYASLGNAVGSIDELKNAKSVAVVNVMCTIPEGGWRQDDAFDVTVTSTHGATSLEGGMLFLSPLVGPFANGPNGERPLMAMASGAVIVENAKSPRNGRVRHGAHMIADAPRTAAVGDSFTLILNKPYAGYSAASEIANAITQSIYGKAGRALSGLPAIATVLDDRSIRVDVPTSERSSTPAFVGDVLATPITVALLKLPKQVVYNQAAGKIVITGDVEISPVALTSADLTITTTVPPPVPTAENPQVQSSHWTGISVGAKESDRAKLQDLLAAFNQLNIPVADQISLLEMMDKAGKLHAKLVID
jgi:flagellar P-ring protein precursor FlgI